MLGLAALVNAADVVGVAVLFGSRLYDFAHQLPVVQVLVLQLFGVNVGVLLHVLAVVDGLVKGAEVVTGQIPLIFAERTISRSSIRTVVIHPDNDAAVFAEGRFSVFVIADDIGSTITGTDGAFLIQPAGRIDGGVARGAVDSNGDILHFVGVAAADGRCKIFVAVSIPVINAGFSANSSYRTTGNGDRCFPLLGRSSVSDRCCSVGADSHHLSVFGDGDAGIH